MLTNDVNLTLPPPIQPASQSKVSYSSREESPHNNGSRGRGTSVDPTSASRSRSRYESNGWEDQSRERSESRGSRNSSNGRAGSRVPLFRRARVDNLKEADIEATNGGTGWEEAEEDEKLRGKQASPSFVKKLGRHFIGIRDEHSFKTPLLRPLRYLSQPHENYLLAFLATFVAILGAGGISYSFKDVQGFEGGTPLAIGSLGATAVLLYVVPESPLSQPRNVIGGHMVSAISGVIISQLFSLSDRFDGPLAEDNTVVQQNSWYHLTPVAYALAVAIAVFGMQITKTVHPPGGATALIASAHRTVNARYTYLLDIFLAVTWMTLWSFFMNNIGRRKYPVYWWKPDQPKEEKKPVLPTTSSPLKDKMNDTTPHPRPDQEKSHKSSTSPPRHFEHSRSDARDSSMARRLGNVDEERGEEEEIRNRREEEQGERGRSRITQ